MNELKVNGTQKFMGIDIPIVEGGFGKDQKVILAKTIAEIHNQPLKKINQLIKDNIEEFDNYTSQFKHDEKHTTTTASKESYFINGKSVDKSEFDKKYEELEEMYMDNICNIMLDYCNFMDEVNEWRKLFRW